MILQRMRFVEESGSQTGGDAAGAWPVPTPREFRALFLSDLHLGSRACRSDRLIEFLRHHRADAIYLVGDIVDGWRLRASWYWPPAHDEILQELLHAAQQGVRVTYVPGNHDEFLRDYCGIHFAGIEVVDSTIHTAADGRRYVVTHGDRFDRLVDRTRRLAPIAHRANLTVIAVNSGFNRMRRLLGLSSWSLIAMGQAQVQDREQLSQRLRTVVGGVWRSRAGRRRRDLRPRASRRDPRAARHSLHQLRRLGRKLHRRRRMP